MNETARLELWLYTALTDNSTLMGLIDTVYAYQAPQTETFAKPFVIYAPLTALDLTGMGPFRIFTTFMYKVVAVGKTTSLQALSTIADQIDTTLQNAQATTTDTRILSCIRVNELSLGEDIQGVSYRQLGGKYRIQVQPLT